MRWLVLVLAGCAAEEAGGWDWGLPDGVPLPIVPDDNPMTAEKVALGRHLFYDTRLSGNETQSCGTCHLQALSWTDGLGRAEGSTGEIHPRGAMNLLNVAYAGTLNWANPTVRLLEDQALTPMFGEFPVELGMAGKEDVLLDRLADTELYPELFGAAYPEQDDPITLHNVVGALSSFERALVSLDAPYDRMLLGGDWEALSDAEKRGMDLFFSESLECFHCHGGFTFSDAVSHDGTVFDDTPFHNNGLYAEDGYPEGSQGLYEITGDPADMGRFKAPSLRNIALTAPYMHDGSLETLSEVIDHYAQGGAGSSLQSAFVGGFSLTAAEKDDLIAFLGSLTDRALLDDARFSDPF